jgi:hypothetical protein
MSTHLGGSFDSNFYPYVPNTNYYNIEALVC